MRQTFRRGIGALLLGFALTGASGFLRAAPTAPYLAAPTTAPAPVIQTAAPDWSKLRAAYDYSAARNPHVTEEPKDDPNALALHISFTGPSGEKVPGVFMRPKADGVYPCALLLHGLTSNKETMIAGFGRALVAQGVAVLALDAPHHGERRIKGENQWVPQVIGVAMHEGVRDYRAALDYLLARKDIDKTRVGLIGYSMGAMMGAIIGGVDDRIDHLALCVGGDPIIKMADAANGPQKEMMLAVCPSFFVGHIAPRDLFMLNGKQDTIMAKSATDVLYAAAREPKRIEWFESGHILPAAAFKTASDWMADKLKSQTSAAKDSAAH